MIYQLNSSKKIFRVEGYHDPDNIRPFTLTLKASAWQAGTVYQKRSASDFDIVVPTTYKGIVYGVVNPGISHATTEPTWSLTIGNETTDYEAGKTEGLTWVALTDNYLPQDEDISAVAITLTNDVEIIGSSYSTSEINFTIGAIASDADARTNGLFVVQVRVTTSTGRRFDVSLEFRLAES